MEHTTPTPKIDTPLLGEEVVYDTTDWFEYNLSQQQMEEEKKKMMSFLASPSTQVPTIQVLELCSQMLEEGNLIQAYTVLNNSLYKGTPDTRKYLLANGALSILEKHKRSRDPEVIRLLVMCLRALCNEDSCAREIMISDKDDSGTKKMKEDLLNLLIVNASPCGVKLAYASAEKLDPRFRVPYFHGLFPESLARKKVCDDEVGSYMLVSNGTSTAILVYCIENDGVKMAGFVEVKSVRMEDPDMDALYCPSLSEHLVFEDMGEVITTHQGILTTPIAYHHDEEVHAAAVGAIAAICSFEKEHPTWGYLLNTAPGGLLDYLIDSQKVCTGEVKDNALKAITVMDRSTARVDPKSIKRPRAVGTVLL